MEQILPLPSRGRVSNREAEVQLLATYDTFYLYSFDGKLLAEYDGAGNCVKDYIYLGTMLIAEYQTSGSKYYYYTSDRINSTRVITDSTGAVVYSAAHDPYGGVQKVWVNTYDPKLKFSGKEREADTGWDYFGARYFAGAQYRWLSPDPLVPVDVAYTDPQAWNLYSYVRNNPVTNMDPTGQYTFANGTAEQRKAFNEALARAAGIPDLKDVVAAYGKEGVDNGVKIEFTNEDIDPTTESKAPQLVPSSDVTIPSSLRGDALVIAIAHEGSHILDWGTFVSEMRQVAAFDSSGTSVIGNDFFDLTKYAAEVRAYNISRLAAQGLGLRNLAYLGIKIMKKNGLDMANLNKFLATKYGVTPTAQGKRLSGFY